MCTNLEWWYQQPEGFRQCVTEHEEYHIWQMQWDPKPSCGECTGEPCEPQFHPGQGTAEPFRRECQAWLRTYSCLMKRAPTHSWVEAVAARNVLDCLAYGGNFKGFM